MDNMTPDPISPMGRAVQAKTQGMTPEQVAALDQQYAQMGLMSINDVITLKQQLDYMKQAGQQQQAGPPPTTTVAQDLRQQIGGGLASLPSNVGNAQSYARGGIVSFAESGLVPPYADAEARAIYEAAEKAANEAAEGRVRGATPSHLYESPQSVGPQQTARSKARTWLTKPRSGKDLVKGGAKGLGWLIPANMGMSALSSAASGDVGTEELFKYYQGIGTIPKDKEYDPSFLYDANLRLLGAGDAAVASVVPDFLEQTSLGKRLGIGDPYENIRARRAQEAEAEAAAAAAQQGNDISQYFTGAAGSGGAGGAESAGIAGLIGNPDLSQFDAIRGRLEGQLGAEQADFARGRAGHVQDVQNEMKGLGIGKAVEEGRARLAKQESDLATDEKRGKWLSAAEGFFKMAEAGGESGSTFFGAAGAGGTAGLAAYNKLLDKIDRKKEQLDQANFELAKLAETQALDAYGRGDARYEAVRNRVMTYENQLNDLGLKQATIQNEFRLKAMEAQVQQSVARIYAGNNKQLQEIARQYQVAAHNAFMAGDAAGMEQILKALGELMVASSGTATVGMYKAQQNPVAALAAAQQGGMDPRAVVSGNVEFVGSRPE